MPRNLRRTSLPFAAIRGNSAAGNGHAHVPRHFLEKDEAPPVPTLDEMLQRETEEEDALSLADFDDEQ